MIWADFYLLELFQKSFSVILQLDQTAKKSSFHDPHTYMKTNNSIIMYKLRSSCYECNYTTVCNQIIQNSCAINTTMHCGQRLFNHWISSADWKTWKQNLQISCNRAKNLSCFFLSFSDSFSISSFSDSASCLPFVFKVTTNQSHLSLKSIYGKEKIWPTTPQLER